MRRMLVIMLLMAAMGVISAQAQPHYEATIQTTIAGSVLNVDMYIVTTSGTSDILGDATFTIEFNSAVLTYVGKDGNSDGRWDDGTDASYNNLTSSNVSARASLDVTKSGSGVGLNVPGTATRIGRLQFTVVDAQGKPGIKWSTLLIGVYSFGAEDITGRITFLDPDDTPLPVTLTSFTGRINPNGRGILLEWATASEVENYGYTVQRKQGDEKSFADVANAFVGGHGTTAESQAYRFVDSTLKEAGRYVYRLKQQDLSGAVRYTQNVTVDATLTAVEEAPPTEFRLQQNYPNPFNPTTVISCELPAPSRLRVVIYDLLGQEVKVLMDEKKEPGRYRLEWEARDCASGVYIYRMTAGSYTETKTMLLLK
jgi:hypothetical protein